MDSIKLQKYFSDCGVMSRRAAEEVIKRGEVLVNGIPATLGDRIDPELDTVEYKGQPVLPGSTEKIYLVLNKPRGYVTTMSDEKGRPTAVSLLSDLGERVYPVGRLDMDSDGLLLFTNDGDLTYALTHPRHNIPKRYHVTVGGSVSPEQLTALSSSMKIDGYTILPVKTRILSEDKQKKQTRLEMILYEGRNRQIRKMCASVGLTVKRLTRVAIGEILLGNLQPGKWRYLRREELDKLRKSL